MTFQFAWVTEAEKTFLPEHHREDEQVFAFALEHTEGDFATLSIDLKNPRRRMLEQDGVWAWLAKDGVPIFFGRLVAVPEEITAEIIRLSFLARPGDYEARIRSVAETLKVAPWWDPVWIVDERLDDPHTVLEARSALWHIDRVTHQVTISDLLRGEDGTVEFGPDDVDYASLGVTFGSPPVRRVHVDAQVSWDQIAVGDLDFTDELLAAFAAAGSPAGLVSSLTGQGLEEDWPEAGTALGGGCKIGAPTLQRADGVWRKPRHVDVLVKAPEPDDGYPSVWTSGSSATRAVLSQPVTARFYVWEFLPSFRLTYDVARQRIERVRFTLHGDVQPVFTEPGEEEEIILGLSSRKISEPIGDDPPPIGDLRGPAYIRTPAACGRSTTWWRLHGRGCWRAPARSRSGSRFGSTRRCSCPAGRTCC